jgi:16S rRNA A1518/A1519 N6-dimethyltransferase RsmA/KsgA/DIM1 with predicted DNA glycosylase/AP lyase activity
MPPVRATCPPSSTLPLRALGPGSRVVEVGAGTGQLTCDLVLRGLVVEAVEPDAAMAAVARAKLSATSLRVHESRFEDAQLAGKLDALLAARGHRFCATD